MNTLIVLGPLLARLDVGVELLEARLGRGEFLVGGGEVGGGLVGGVARLGQRFACGVEVALGVGAGRESCRGEQ